MLFFFIFGCSSPPPLDCQLPGTIPARIAQGDILWLPTPQECDAGEWQQETGPAQLTLRQQDDEWTFTTLHEVGNFRFSHNQLEVDVDVSSLKLTFDVSN